MRKLTSAAICLAALASVLMLYCALTCDCFSNQDQYDQGDFDKGIYVQRQVAAEAFSYPLKMIQGEGVGWALFIVFHHNLDALSLTLESFQFSSHTLIERLIIIDNSPHKDAWKVGVIASEVIPTPFVLTYSEVHNFVVQIAFKRYFEHYFVAHADVYILPETSMSVFDTDIFDCFAQQTKRHPHWAIIFFSYDHLAAFRTQAMIQVPWDEGADCDEFGRLRASGYSIHDCRVHKDYQLTHHLSIDPSENYEQRRSVLEEGNKKAGTWQDCSLSVKELQHTSSLKNASFHHIKSKYGRDVSCDEAGSGNLQCKLAWPKCVHCPKQLPYCQSKEVTREQLTTILKAQITSKLPDLVGSSHSIDFKFGSKDCKQNHGRKCSKEEVSRPYLTVPSKSSVYFSQRELWQRGNYAVDCSQHYFLNPGAVVFEGTLYLFARLRIVGSSCVSCPDNSLYSSFNCITSADKIQLLSFSAHVQANQKFQLISPPLVQDFHLEYLMARHTSLGCDDPRPFTWNNQVFIIFNFPIMDDNGSILRRIGIRRVLPSVSDVIRLRFKGLWNIEKNWAPIGEIPNSAGGTDFLFARTFEPFQVLQCDREGMCRDAAQTSSRAHYGRMMKEFGASSVHFATGAIRLSENYYGGLIHLIKKHRNENSNEEEFRLTQSYHVLPFVFATTPPFAIRAVGRKPITFELPQGKTLQDGSVYSSGITYVDGRVVIGYNFVQYKTVEETMAFYIDTVDAVFGNLQSFD